jgi:EmrB/QacA subfamily drug resistance transporter
MITKSGCRTSALGAACHEAGAVIALRFPMGASAAFVYPTTLSIITNAYPDRAERAGAVGVWGAVTGLGVAFGPITGGWLLVHFYWGSVFLALVPVALAAAALATWLVPESRDRNAPRLDVLGLALSTLAITAVVYTIIEAPNRGWGDPLTVAGFVMAAVLAGLFILVERRREHPMLDVRLFRTPAFSAASGAVTVAFFALFGFIFLITQYMQFIRGFDALSTGTRILPVAASIAGGSVAGVQIAKRAGTRGVVVTGLILLGGAFAWIATSSTFESYTLIAAQMVMMGLGLGMTTAPATESILSTLPPSRAGVGSAVNDATRETGGTLGVAVIGSVYSSAYLHQISRAPVGHLPAAAEHGVRDSVGAAFAVAGKAGQPLQSELVSRITAAFMHGLHLGSWTAAIVCAVGALGACALPGRAFAAKVHENDLHENGKNRGSIVVVGETGAGL